MTTSAASLSLTSSKGFQQTMRRNNDARRARINRSFICAYAFISCVLNCCHIEWAAGTRPLFDTELTTQMLEPLKGQAPDHDQKRAALGYLHEAWLEARIDGIDGDCLAQACLFAAFAEFVSTYGEEPAARLAEGLAVRIRQGEFSLALSRQ